MKFGKEFKYVHVFCAKNPPSKKEAAIFVPSRLSDTGLAAAAVAR
jgi:hypothetical protein